MVLLPYRTSSDVHWELSQLWVHLERDAKPRTAMLQAKLEDRSTRPANSGSAETLTPLARRASVTLKLGASKVRDATRDARVAKRKDRIVTDIEVWRDAGILDLNERMPSL
jgi:hypothetical protein